jgi:hypothetical protein
MPRGPSPDLSWRTGAAISPLLLTLAVGCGSATPSNVTPTVAISTPPTAASAAPETTAAPENTTTGSDAEEPPQDCDGQIAAAKAASASTIKDCQEIGRQVLFVRQTCDSENGGSDASTWALLDSAECMEDVGSADLTRLSKALPAAAATRTKAAHDGIKGAVSEFCTRDCSMSFTAHCTVGVLACMDSAYRAAASGSLEFGAASKVGKDIRAFADQASALCALPATAWKGGKVPASCANAALSWLQGCADPTAECPGK